MSSFLRGCGFALCAAAATIVCWPVLGPSLHEGGWIEAGAPAFAQAPREPELEFDVYAAGCLEELEGVDKIHFPPLLQCANGPILPITRAEVPIRADFPGDSINFTDKTDCDRPPILDISSGGIGQCVPNSRLQVQSVKQENVKDDKDLPRYALLCRNYKFRSLEQEENKPEYDDIAMIVYSPRNKKTCFFQRFANANLFFKPVGDSAFEALEAISGADIPSPFEKTASTFWDNPSVVKNINCAQCHDANPFVRTPYVHQVAKGAHALPKRTPGEGYGIVWLDHFFKGEWKEFHAYLDIKPTGDGERGACLTCHSLGPGNSSGDFTKFATGTPAPNQYDTGKFANSHWMPPAANESTWTSKFGVSVKALEDCNADPDKKECGKTNLH